MTKKMLRDVIEIPEELSANDFVLKLSDGVSQVRATLASYVVTPQLAACFDEALSYVKGALEKGRSDAAFLHGSFGSGKSHFMAVLHAILRHDPDARALDGLEWVLEKHDRWLAGRKVLCLTYHLIGAQSIEQAVLGGYVDQIRRLHPDAPIPEVHRTDGLLSDADNLRTRFGDEAFFASLRPSPGQSTPQPGGWGKLAPSWNAESYAAARNAPASAPERMRLVSDLIRVHFQGYTGNAGYLNLDQGLAVVSTHARQLGYDCVVLFLDELVLWLASRSSDPAFVGDQGARVAKLVEASDAHRAVPLVSFVARQRDLRDFLGDNVPGAEKYAIGETFRWWEDRFNKVTLEDRNLPVIVGRRLLRALPGQEGELSAAFTKVTREPKIWNVLLEGLDESADAASFRQTYPFSPALVSTMVALSGLLQRERTALRTMAELLRRGRAELTVDDIVPVGDVFDVLMDAGVVPLTDDMKQHFANARTLYAEKLLPRLLDRHKLAEGAQLGLPRTHPFVTDDRLVKTALLAALAPKVPALANLTAGKLAALNHGTIASPIRGREAERVLGLFRELAASGVSEIHLSGDHANPLITVQLAGVDYESVLDRVMSQDNTGERRRLLRELVFRSLGLPLKELDTIGGGLPHTVTWRGSKRTVDVLFGNVRDPHELPDASLMAEGDRWKLVIDFPFDTAGHGPSDDLARIEDLERSGERSRTVCWVPAFFTAARETDLGELVRLRYVLASPDRFESNANHLSVQDRATAKALLENRKRTLEEKLLGVIQQAYGAASRLEADIDASRGHSSFFGTLDHGLNLGAPVGQRLADCMEHLIDQMLSAQYPEHPRFASEVRKADTAKVLEYLEQAAAEQSGRVPVQAKDRDVLRKVANPLGVGEALENAFLFTGDTFWWRRHFTQLAAQEGLGDVIPVAKLLAWMDLPQPRGLDAGTRGLVIAAFALIQDRVWYRHGSRTPRPPLEQITPDYELRLPKLPDEAAFRTAQDRAAKIFGVTVTPLRSAANVGKLAGLVRAQARALRDPAQALHDRLAEHKSVLSVDPAWPRLSTAAEALDLVKLLVAETGDTELVEVLAATAMPVKEEVLARSLKSAQQTAETLRRAQWDLLRPVAAMTGDAQAASIIERLRETARRNEFETVERPLAVALREAGAEAARFLASRVPDGGSSGGATGGGDTSGTTGGTGGGGSTDPAGTTGTGTGSGGSGSVEGGTGGGSGSGSDPVPAGKEHVFQASKAEQVLMDVLVELSEFAKQHPEMEITITWKAHS
ncbi:hypothetical protein Ssi03_19730 [Sphaerisporangium siamense]|nr:hypothetical protein Ssi03_19730 [Sphaerisporangium siamense]